MQLLYKRFKNKTFLFFYYSKIGIVRKVAFENITGRA